MLGMLICRLLCGHAQSSAMKGLKKFHANILSLMALVSYGEGVAVIIIRVRCVAHATLAGCRPGVGTQHFMSYASSSSCLHDKWP